MFAFSTDPINTAELTARLARPEAGACVTFEGWVRDHNEGQSVQQLEYEAYEGLAVKEGEKIMAEALHKFNVCDAQCIHRVGRLDIGDTAVWVGVTAAHRDEAYRASRYIIDEIKERVPIWKKEHYVQGDSGWINCATNAAEHHGHPSTRAH